MQQKTTYSRYSYLYYFWLFIPAIIYFAFVNNYGVNIPYRDDYRAILEFLVDFKSANFSHKVSLLFSQNNEHRILSSHILYVLYYSLFNEINFRNIIFIGNLQLVIIFLIGVHFIKKGITDFWYIAAFVFGICLFDISSYENATFAMASMQNYGVIMLFFLSLLFYSFSSLKWLIPAIFFQGLCAFSSGNGMVAGLALVLYNLLCRNKLNTIASLVSFSTFTGLYFVNYQSPQGSLAGDTNNAITFFIHMAGAHFSYDYGLLAGILVLIALGGILPFNSKFQFKSNVLPMIAVLIFVMASMAVTSKFRSKTIHDSYASRYLIYAHLLTGVGFFFLFIKIDKSKIKWPIIIVSLIGLLHVYKENYNWGIGGFERQENRIEVTDFIDHPQKDQLREIAVQACTAGIYCIEEHR